nr:MAG TPA: hypothetical protein [Caudoviricetes sp.]
MPCKPRRRPNAPVPRCRYRGEGAGPSMGLTGRPEGAPGRGARSARGRRPSRSGPASGGSGSGARLGRGSPGRGGARPGRRPRRPGPRTRFVWTARSRPAAPQGSRRRRRSSHAGRRPRGRRPRLGPAQSARQLDRPARPRSAPAPRPAHGRRGRAR